MLDEQRDQIRTRLRGLDEEVERLRHDPTTQIPAPDDTPDELLIDKFGQIERLAFDTVAGMDLRRVLCGVSPRWSGAPGV